MAGGMVATAPSSITAVTHLGLGAHAEGNPLKASVPSPKLGSRRLVIRAESSSGNPNGRRAAVIGFGAALLSAMATSGSANAGLVEDLLAKSSANKALNDKKRLVTSGANIARAYTVQFGTCQVPYNFTGCQDLAKLKVHGIVVGFSHPGPHSNPEVQLRLTQFRKMMVSNPEVQLRLTQFRKMMVYPDYLTPDDEANVTNVRFLSDDLKLECEGKDKYKCGSNVFWKW